MLIERDPAGAEFNENNGTLDCLAHDCCHDEKTDISQFPIARYGSCDGSDVGLVGPWHLRMIDGATMMSKIKDNTQSSVEETKVYVLKSLSVSQLHVNSITTTNEPFIGWVKLRRLRSAWDLTESFLCKYFRGFLATLTPAYLTQEKGKIESEVIRRRWRRNATPREMGPLAIVVSILLYAYKILFITFAHLDSHNVYASAVHFLQNSDASAIPFSNSHYLQISYVAKGTTLATWLSRLCAHSLAISFVFANACAIARTG